MTKPFLKDIKAIVLEARRQLRRHGASRFDARAHPWPDSGWLGDFWYTPADLARECESGKRYLVNGYNQHELTADAVIRVPTREEWDINPDPARYVLDVG